MRQTKSEAGIFENAAEQKRSVSVRSRRPDRRWKRRIVFALIASLGITPQGGCGLLSRVVPPGPHDTKESYHDGYGLQIEYPEVTECATPPSMMANATTEPLTLEDPANLPAYDMSLEQAIQLAVQQSPVLRNIGGTVVTAPQATATIYDPALTSASPVLGTEAALAAFDAQYTQRLFWDFIDRPNNTLEDALLFGVPPATVGTLANFTGDLSKTTATGARFAIRHVVDYNLDNQRVGFRRFSSTFAGWVEAEWRQPLLQGAGTTYNRIAGPTTVPGQYNGVLIARVNEDVALADFEEAVINLVYDVEQAYWDLVTAYRILDTAVKGREAALQTFQYQQVRLEVGSGRSDEEAQARSQFYQFETQVQVALGGIAGLYRTEQRLRYLIGMAATDGRLIRPSTQPTDTRVVFDWDSALGQALDRRVEVRRQRLEVSRREMELLAAKLNFRPRLDLVAQYRFRGLGNHLIGPSDAARFQNMYADITSGDFQEAQAGVEFNFPVGFRAAGVAIAHAKLNVRRERALLAETELRISHDLSDAARNIGFTHQLLETNYNRLLADLNQVDVLRRRYLDGSDNINFLLQAQREVVASASDFYQSLSEYNLSIRDFHRQKGSLLAYNQVQLAEGPWAAGAAQDAYQAGRFLHPRHDPSKVCAPIPLTSGPFDPAAIQDTSGLPAAPLAVESVPNQFETPAQPMIDAQPAEDPVPDAAIGDGLIE